MKAVIDTSALIEYTRGNDGVSRLLEGSDGLNISAISAYEALAGVQGAKRAKMKEFFRQFPQIPFTSRDADAAARIHDQLKESGKMINSMDVLIAAQAAERGLVVITMDSDFENVRGLAVHLIK